VLPVHLDTIRLFLHVLGATIWVGGQLTLAGLVPVLRRISPDAPREAARRFNVIGWSAFALLVATGIWNITALGDHVSDSYRATLSAKLVVVAISGIAAFLHIRATSRRGLAVWGALTGLSALGALFLGMLLGS
jgi:putative copper export protein